MSDIKLQSNVPAPKRGATRSEYPIKEMKVGDSFFVDSSRLSEASRRGAIHALARYYGMKTTSKKTEEDGVKGLRTWRIE